MFRAHGISLEWLIIQQEIESLRKGRRVWMRILKISWQMLAPREALFFFLFPSGSERFGGGNGWCGLLRVLSEGKLREQPHLHRTSWWNTQPVLWTCGAWLLLLGAEPPLPEWQRTLHNAPCLLEGMESQRCNWNLAVVLPESQD